MINILCNADRTWQMKHFGYGFQTHSWADMVATRTKLETKGFCQCLTGGYKYKVKGLSGYARVCSDPTLRQCDNCHRDLFFSNKYHIVSAENRNRKNEIKALSRPSS